MILRKERAQEYMPVLKWIMEDGPDKEMKRTAKSLYQKFQAIDEWKQEILTPKEARMLKDIDASVPSIHMTKESQGEFPWLKNIPKKREE